MLALEALGAGPPPHHTEEDNGGEGIVALWSCRRSQGLALLQLASLVPVCASQAAL